ncbi:MAG: hypothetical protein KGL93_08575 [Gemmatimonadota bacterium]|nr:hypothetical protein [Gemmatimonadota bacterium]
MNLPSILLWGFVASVVMATITEGSRGLGWTRMSVPFMLGSMFTADYDSASPVGIVVHLLGGWAFALLYALVFQALGRATWWTGALLGLVQAIAVLVLVMPVLPSLHPRMANERTGPEPTRALEPPGFMALNYGTRTPLFTVLAHLAYGAILGGGYRLLS